MKLVRLLVIGMMFVVLWNVGGPIIQADVTKMISNANPNAGQAESLIAQTGSNWNNISQTISEALNHTAK